MRMLGDVVDASLEARGRTSRVLTAGLPVVLLSAVTMLGGCQSDGGSTDGSADMSTESAMAAKVDDQAAQIAEVEARYVVGPITANRVGYRIDWQFDTGNAAPDKVVVTDDAVFALAPGNFLTRIRRDDGQRLWSLPVAQPGDEIFGVTYVPADGRVFVMTGSELHELDSATGAILAKHDLQQICNTEPITYGDSLLYGARNGQVIWFSHAIAFQHNAYQVAPGMTLPPSRHGDYLAAVGKGGNMMVINARSVRQYWNRKLIEEVVAPVAITNDAVFVAGQDQYIQAFDVVDGMRIWADLTESPLEDSPVVLGDRLYQQVPGVGLCCYETLPFDSPGGQKHWTADGVNGTVISTRGNELLVWDDETRVLDVVDAKLGSIVSSHSWPKVSHLQCSSMNNGELVVTDDQGNVLRLLPKN